MITFIVFWTVIVFASIAWYGFLLFYVGYKGGREIIQLTRTLAERNRQNLKEVGGQKS